MSKELAISSNAIELKSIGDVIQFCEYMVKSDLVPSDCKNVPNAMARVMYGMEINLSAMQSLQSICVINGKPSVWGDAIPALCYASGQVEFIEEHIEGEGDRRCAVFRTKRKGQPNVNETRFSVADAKLAKLWGKQGPWTQYPDRMMQMRARSFGLRDVYADVLKGIILAEEANDYPDEAKPKTYAEEIPAHNDKVANEIAAAQEPRSDALNTLLESDVEGYWEPSKPAWAEAQRLVKLDPDKMECTVEDWLDMANAMCEACGMGQGAAVKHMQEQHGYGVGGTPIPAPYAKNLFKKVATMFITVADLLSAWKQLEKAGTVKKNTSLKLLKEIHVRLQADMAPDLISVDKFFFESIENAMAEDPAQLVQT